MTDDELIAKKLAFIETCVNELRTLARPDRIANDVREERFVEHTLQIAVQAALDVASHIVSDLRMGEPANNKELFDLLARHGWLDSGLVTRLRDMAGFRNVLVHGYGDVDVAIVEGVLRHQLGDLLAFVATVRQRLAGSSRP
ncbi:MAG: type VII toxin-antitoxin system HepT family RNase toxin [Myxococcota bacterium]